MKSLTFNKNSWHYWFVNKTTNYFELNDGYDICSYTRAFIGGVFISLFMFYFGALFLEKPFEQR
jgi:hypothetical protein